MENPSIPRSDTAKETDQDRAFDRRAAIRGKLLDPGSAVTEKRARQRFVRKPQS